MGLPNPLLQQMESKLKEWETTLQTYQVKIKELETKADSLDVGAKANFQPQLDQLHEKIEEVQSTVDAGRHE